MIGREKSQKFKAELGSRNCSRGGVHSCCRSEDRKFLERIQIGDCRCSHTETADLIPSAPWKNSSVSKRDEMSLDSWKCFNNRLQNIFKFANVIILPLSCELTLVTNVFVCLVMWRSHLFSTRILYMVFYIVTYITRATGLNLQLPVKLTSIIFLGKQTPYCHKFIINCKN